MLRLVGFPGDPVFCCRQTGGLVCAVELAGGVTPLRAPRALLGGGDAFCEWELRWETPSAVSATPTSKPGQQKQGG